MINDFVKRVNLSNLNVYDLNIKTLKFLEHCNKKGIECITFADSHSLKNSKFESFRNHCLINLKL